MLHKKHRKLIISAFVIGVIFLSAILISSWNATYKGVSLGVWPLIFSILSLIAFGYLFLLAHGLSNVTQMDEFIDQKVSEGRSALLSELKSQEEKKKENSEEEDHIPVKAKELIPSGKFKNIDTFSKKLLISLADRMNCVQGIVYIAGKAKGSFTFCAGYALTREEIPSDFKLGENLNGETAKSQEVNYIDEIPEDYFEVESGLGTSKVGFLCIIPVLAKKNTIALIELASFTEFSEKNRKLVEQLQELLSAKMQQFEKA